MMVVMIAAVMMTSASAMVMAATATAAKPNTKMNAQAAKAGAAMFATAVPAEITHNF